MCGPALFANAQYLGQLPCLDSPPHIYRERILDHDEHAPLQALRDECRVHRPLNAIRTPRQSRLLSRSFDPPTIRPGPSQVRISRGASAPRQNPRCLGNGRLGPSPSNTAHILPLQPRTRAHPLAIPPSHRPRSPPKRHGIQMPSPPSPPLRPAPPSPKEVLPADPRHRHHPKGSHARIRHQIRPPPPPPRSP